MVIYADLEYDDGTTHRHPLVADESKKSVYWLKDLLPTEDPSASTSSNVKALVLVAADGTKNAFYIGGFQLQGMAKHIKVYVDDSEKLLISVRGIKSSRLQAFFKTQCVIPGGARPVAKFVRLELEPAAAIHQIRWTIRMRNDDSTSGGGGGGGGTSSTSNDPDPKQKEHADPASNGAGTTSIPVSTDEASSSSMGMDSVSHSNTNCDGFSNNNLLHEEDFSERGQDTIHVTAEPPPSGAVPVSAPPSIPPVQPILQAASTLLVESTIQLSSTALLGNTPATSTSNTNEIVATNSSSTVISAATPDAVVLLTQHMADLTSAMRELTATIQDHQRFLQEQQHQQDTTR
jgi:hypothetical protein